MKVVHITTLGDGGAEHSLFKIYKCDNLNDHTVIAKATGKYFNLKKLGIVYCINMKNIFSILKFSIL